MSHGHSVAIVDKSNYEGRTERPGGFFRRPSGLSFNGVLASYTRYGNTQGPTGSAHATDRMQFLDDLTWIKEKHTVKMGFEYRHHIIPYFYQASRKGSYRKYSQGEMAGMRERLRRCRQIRSD